MSSHVPPELASACAEIRPATSEDSVCGQPAKFVAEPATTAETAALLSAAETLGLTVHPRGHGTRLSWGNPPSSCDLIVSTRRLDQVIEHAAGDLVVTVQAGVALAALQERLATEGQRLALDPPQSGTIGGLIATNAAGPLRFRYGAPRDLMIGLTIVRADGIVAKAGGKVVKNVAGYDLGKLFAGSYGTLGLITQATFRLHPLPAASTWVTAETGDLAAAAAIILSAATSPVAPAAIELAWPSASAPLTISVLVEGAESSVAERAGLLATSVATSVASETAGSRPAPTKRAGRDPVSLALGAPHTRVRATFWAGRLTEVLETVSAVAAAHAIDPAVSGSAAAGVLDLTIPGDASAEATTKLIAELRAALALADGDMPAGSVVVVDAPADVRAAVDMWGPVPSVDLMRAVKDQFDPGHRMAPGRFAGGI